MASRNTTSRSTAHSSSTTRPVQAIRCSSATLPRQRSRARSLRRLRACIVTFRSGLRTTRSFILFRDRCPIVWTCGASVRQVGLQKRLTNHDAIVSHPVFLNAETLLYLATDVYGFGPWIYSLDVERRISRRVSVGVDRFTSLAASLTAVASPRHRHARKHAVARPHYRRTF